VPEILSIATLKIDPHIVLHILLNSYTIMKSVNKS